VDFVGSGDAIEMSIREPEPKPNGHRRWNALKYHRVEVFGRVANPTLLK
jgi:hypothetical protein